MNNIVGTLSRYSIAGTLSNLAAYPSVMQSNYCINCFPEYIGATFIFMGNSVCEKHFKSKYTKSGNIVKKALIDEGR